MSDILIVEDDGSIAQFVAASLSAAGMKPRACATARAARDELRMKIPDLMILDLGLPDEDGVSLIAGLRPQCAMPILVLVGAAVVAIAPEDRWPAVVPIELAALVWTITSLRRRPA